MIYNASHWFYNKNKDIEQTVNQLNTKWQSLKSEIATYDEYVDNADKVEDFYDEINDTVEKACVRLQKYTVQYAELIMNSNISNDNKYDAFDDLLIAYMKIQPMICMMEFVRI